MIVAPRCFICKPPPAATSSGIYLLPTADRPATKSRSVAGTAITGFGLTAGGLQFGLTYRTNHSVTPIFTMKAHSKS